MSMPCRAMQAQQHVPLPLSRGDVITSRRRMWPESLLPVTICAPRAREAGRERACNYKNVASIPPRPRLRLSGTPHAGCEDDTYVL